MRVFADDTLLSVEVVVEKFPSCSSIKLSNPNNGQVSNNNDEMK